MARSSRQPDFLRNLIHTGYLPVELPPVVTARYFADYCAIDFKFFAGHINRLIAISTKFDTYTYRRADGSRRSLAIVHPLAQLGVALIVTKYRAPIKSALSRAPGSLYRSEE